MEAFVGSWQLEQSSDMNEIMRRLEVGFIARKAANTLKPTLTISQQEGGKFLMKTQSTFKSSELQFELGKQFNETTQDGRKVKSVFTLEADGSLKQVQTSNKQLIISRRVDGDHMINVSFGCTV